MKVCKKCGMEKQPSAFPPYFAAGKRGLRGTCRLCWNAKWSPVILVHQSRYYHENHNGLADRVKARSRAAYANNPKPQRQRNRDYEKRYPDRAKAKAAVARAIKSGVLQRQPCSVCESVPAQAHHDDYAKLLNVRWLCRTHHGEHHRLAHRSRALSVSA